ncbi:GlcNAc-PI de-N-acetylase [bacterium A37T11]|nr:GlcNAc-PI de-N-acetylase [bacterium A37T11]
MKVAVIVAHPDDETLWAGGTLLSHPQWQVFVASVCRGDDADRAPKFTNALQVFHAQGAMATLDDGVEQTPLNEEALKQTILRLLPPIKYDLVITHDPSGEYTYHLRHIEVSKAVINLWNDQQITSKELWTFAYHDGNKKFYPRAIHDASIKSPLSLDIYAIKHQIMHEVYGYPLDGWEVKTTPMTEAFWSFTDTNMAKKWLESGRVLS